MTSWVGSVGRSIVQRFDNIENQVTDLVENPCDAPWTVYLETFFPAAGDALLVLLIPSPGEILENYLQPKPGRGGSRRGDRDDPRRRPGRGGVLRRAWRRGIPSIDDMIADRLPGSDAFSNRTPGLGEKAFWTTIDLVDRALWYWLVLDIVDEFTYAWSSGIMESRFCTADFNAAATYEGKDGEVNHQRPLPADLHDNTFNASNCSWTTDAVLRSEGGGNVLTGQYLVSVSGLFKSFGNTGYADWYLATYVTFSDGSVITHESTPQRINLGETAALSQEVEVAGAVEIVTQPVRIPGTTNYGHLYQAEAVANFFGNNAPEET